MTIIISRNFRAVYDGKRLSHPLHADRPVTWSIVGGADQADFEIVNNLLRWSSKGVQDFNAPADSDTNNSYVVTVRATDGAETADQTITITVAEPTGALDSNADQDNDASEVFFDDDLASDMVWLDYFPPIAQPPLIGHPYSFGFIA